MTALSQSRSIRRTDLESRASSEGFPGSPDSTLHVRYRERLELSYGDEHRQVSLERKGPPQDAVLAATEPPPHEDEASYEFRLFARPSGPGASDNRDNGVKRVALESPTPINGEPGFIKPRRPEGYYFTGATSAEQAERFSRTAVSGEQVLESLRMRWPGSQLPWRVTVIKATSSTQPTKPKVLSQDVSGRRKRKGKKRRIIIRKRIQANSAMKLAAQENQAEKEAAEKEKRTRKNREKKVKKRQKDKLKKSLEAQGDGRMANSD